MIEVALDKKELAYKYRKNNLTDESLVSLWVKHPDHFLLYPFSNIGYQ